MFLHSTFVVVKMAYNVLRPCLRCGKTNLVVSDNIKVFSRRNCFGQEKLAMRRDRCYAIAAIINISQRSIFTSIAYLLPFQNATSFATCYRFKNANSIATSYQPIYSNSIATCYRIRKANSNCVQLPTKRFPFQFVLQFWNLLF